MNFPLQWGSGINFQPTQLLSTVMSIWYWQKGRINRAFTAFKLFRAVECVWSFEQICLYFKLNKYFDDHIYILSFDDKTWWFVGKRQTKKTFGLKQTKYFHFLSDIFKYAVVSKCQRRCLHQTLCHYHQRVLCFSVALLSSSPAHSPSPGPDVVRVNLNYNSSPPVGCCLPSYYISLAPFLCVVSDRWNRRKLRRDRIDCFSVNEL